MKDDYYLRRKDLMNQPLTTGAVSPEDEHQVRLTVVTRVSDTEEARMFLSMLGIVPKEEEV